MSALAANQRQIVTFDGSASRTTSGTCGNVGEGPEENVLNGGEVEVEWRRAP